MVSELKAWCFAHAAGATVRFTDFWDDFSAAYKRGIEDALGPLEEQLAPASARLAARVRAPEAAPAHAATPRLFTATADVAQAATCRMEWRRLRA